MLMAKKPNVLPHPQNALNKFMVRIIIERDRLNDAFALDGNTISIFKVKPPSGTRPDSDDVGGLVDSHLEDMYHSLYGEALELRKLLIDAKGESVKAGVEFKLTLNPLLNSMFKVHESCIEGLRTGNGWNTEAHCKAFEELFQELGTYGERINQIVANPAVNPAALQPSVSQSQVKIIGKTKESQKINDQIIVGSRMGLSDQQIKDSIDKKFPDADISLERIRSRRLVLKKNNLM